MPVCETWHLMTSFLCSAIGTAIENRYKFDKNLVDKIEVSLIKKYVLIYPILFCIAFSMAIVRVYILKIFALLVRLRAASDFGRCEKGYCRPWYRHVWFGLLHGEGCTYNAAALLPCAMTVSPFGLKVVGECSPFVFPASRWRSCLCSRIRPSLSQWWMARSWRWRTSWCTTWMRSAPPSPWRGSPRESLPSSWWSSWPWSPVCWSWWVELTGFEPGSFCL